MPIGTLPEKGYDLACVGFGPASLAIAVALHDFGVKVKVIFLERQSMFAWHAGMLLPSARMQISFLKDLATFRDPRSKFTFLNYLKNRNRLVAFANLGTFYPLREEFNDYLTWAAGHFADCVQYGSEAVSISPIPEGSMPIKRWDVTYRDMKTNTLSSLSARHVVIAMGGQPSIPAPLQNQVLSSKVIHSSRYLQVPSLLLTDASQQVRIAVIGGGQSAAEIFEDLMLHYSQGKISLITSGSALKTSDDSPLYVNFSPTMILLANSSLCVNEIFDPHRVNEFYNLPVEARKQAIIENRSTNYSVVRPELLDRLYDKMYHQRLKDPNQQNWDHRIVTLRQVVGADLTNEKVSLHLKNLQTGDIESTEPIFDLVIVATGYLRNAHVKMLQPARYLFADSPSSVERDYRIKFKDQAVAEDSGIWLQGCCEESHSVSEPCLVGMKASLSPSTLTAERYPTLNPRCPWRRDCRVHLWQVYRSKL